MLAVWRLNAGIASTTRRPAARTSETTGLRRTRFTIAAQVVFSPAFHGWSLMIGTPPFSTRSPSQARVAGSTVSEPMTAIATTRIVPVANDWKVGSPDRYIPAIAIITV